MNQMKNLIKEYLSRPTDYAILFSGEWGTGKTHYFKNTLKPFIENEIQAIDSPKNYKVVYVSMFGLSSIEEIQQEIFVALMPLLKKKAIRLSGGIGKIIARGVLEFSNLGNIDDYISDAKRSGIDSLELKNVVLCFDDLERKDPYLSFDQLIGYVNSIVDVNGGKVILISNDNFGDDKKEFKERVIGLNIEFTPNNQKTVAAIIDVKYKHSDKLFHEFLLDNIKVINRCSELIDCNYRSLKFALEKLLNVHALWLVPLQYQKGKDPGLPKKIEFVIRFVIGISHEFRFNKISFKKREDLETPKAFDPALWDAIDLTKVQIATENVDIPQSYKEDFKNKYLEKGKIRYTFIDSLYAYVTAGAELQVDDLVENLNFTFYAESQIKKREYELINLFNDQPFQFSNEEYVERISEILQFARDRKYRATDYPLVYHLILRFGNILNLNPGKLMEEFKNLMTESQDGLSQQSEMYEIQLPSESEYRNELACLEQHGKDIIRVRRMDLAQKNQKAMAESFINDDWKSFKARYDKNTGWQHAPFFHRSKPAKFVKRIKGLTNNELNHFLLMIQNRYRDGYWGDFIEEYPFVKEVALEMEQQYKIGNAFSDYLLSNIHKVYIEAGKNLKTGYEKKISK